MAAKNRRLSGVRESALRASASSSAFSSFPEQLRYLNPRRKLAEVATRLMNTLTVHVNAMV
jgi:hypothetical protein